MKTIDNLSGTHRAPRPGIHRLQSRSFAAGAWLTVSFAVAVLAGCGSSQAPEAIPASAYASPAGGALAVGDSVRIVFPGAPDYNQLAKIQRDGTISLPVVGAITASGRTPGSLQQSLQERYRPHLNDPTVFVALEQPVASVYVSGEVGTPGKVPLDRSMTAFEAVMEVGGFSKLANPRKAYVIRTEQGKQKRYALDLRAPMSGAESQAFYLRPFDVVFVERSYW